MESCGFPLHDFHFLTREVDMHHVTFKIRHTPDFTPGRIRRIGDLTVSNQKTKYRVSLPASTVLSTTRIIISAWGSGMIIDEEK